MYNFCFHEANLATGCTDVVDHRSRGTEPGSNCAAKRNLAGRVFRSFQHHQVFTHVPYQPPARTVCGQYTLHALIFLRYPAG